MRYFLIVMLGLIQSLSFSQSGIIQGVIHDSATKESLIGVSVSNQDFVGVSSDFDGKYQISIPIGEHIITFSYIGYETKKINISILDGETKIHNISLIPKTNSLDAVVITAGKFEQKESEITMSIAVIRPAIIENKATTSMDDILQNTSGVAIVDGEPQIRGGSGFNFGAGSRVTIMVDDMSMLSGDAGRPTWGFLPVENIQQVEVIKGASSVLYGSSAINGVINIRTGFAKDTPETKVTLFQGLYSNPQTESSHYWDNTPMQTGLNFFHSRKVKNLSIVAGISILADDGYLGPILVKADTVEVDGIEEPTIIAADTASSKYDPFNVNRYDATKRFRGNLNLSYRPSKIPGLVFGINTNWLSGESLSSLLWENDSSGLYQPLDGAATRTKQIVGNIDPSITYLSSKNTKHILRGRWHTLKNNNDNNQSNFSDVYMGEYQIQQNFDSLGIKDFVLTAGAIYSKTNSQSDLYKGRDSTGVNTFENQAAYLQLDKKFFNRLNVSAGMRYEKFQINGQSEGKPVFRSGLNLQLWEATFIRASYGQGYRFPSIAEKYIETSVGALEIFPNPDLQSETSTSTEIGLRQGISFGKFQGMIDVAVFKQTYSNFVEFTFGQWKTPDFFNPDGPDLGLGFKSVNTGDAEVTGYEITIGGQQKIKKLDINFQLGYTYTKPLTKSPNHVYAEYTGDPDAIGVFESFGQASYLSTSSDTTDNILKYRIQEMARAELELSYGSFSFGNSFRLNSQMKNIDNVYYLLDDEETPPNIPFGLKHWTDNHQKANYIIDSRISYTYKKKHKISIIVNNLLNEEYTLRLLKIEAPRTTVFQYVFTL